VIEEGCDSFVSEWVGCPSHYFISKGYKMKKGIHPNYVDCKVTCACGNEFTIKSDRETMSIDICNECHPFFTGSEKIVDAAGRVEKFKNKYKLS
jgi:large subunit ribosomal protein L31